MIMSIDKAGLVNSRSVNHADGNRPCAWFTERLYTRPALCIASV